MAEIFYPARATSADGGGLTPVVANSTPITATAGNLYVVDVATIGSAIIANLPSSPDDEDQIGFCDGSGSDPNAPNGFGLFNLTINPGGGHTIQGAANRTLSTENEAVWLTFSASLNRWTVVSDASTASAGGGGVTIIPPDGANGEYLLFAHNNGVNYIHPTNNVDNDVDFSTTDFDPDSGYNSGTGEYTFARDAVVIIKGQLRNTVAGTSTTHECKLFLDTGGGYNEWAYHSSYAGDEQEADTYPIQKFLSASIGDKIKLVSNLGLSAHPYSGNPEDSHLQIIEIGTGTNSGNLGRILLFAHNNGTQITHTTGGATENLNFSTAAVDPLTAYSAGVYTFAASAVVRVVAQIGIDTSSNSGPKRINIELNTGGGFNVVSTNEEHQSDSTITDTVTAIRSFEVSAGNTMRLSLYQNDDTPFTFDGSQTRTFWQILDLGGAEGNESAIVLNANNNGVNYTHTTLGVEQNINFSTATIDPFTGYNATTGEYTFKRDGIYLITAQLRVPNGASSDTSTLEIEYDSGSGYSKIGSGQRRHSGNTEGDCIRAYIAYQASIDDKVKLISKTKDNSAYDYLGTDESSYFEITYLGGFYQGAGRETLLNDTTYYVDPAGNNTNNGLTPGTAFKTLQFAVDKAIAADPGFYSVTIELAAGDYTAEGEIILPRGIGTDYLLKGTTPDTAITNRLLIRGNWSLEDIAIDATNTGLTVSTFAVVQLRGTINLKDTTTSGFGPYIAVSGGTLNTEAGGVTIEVDNTSIPPTAHNSFIYCQENGNCRLEGSTVNFNANIQFDQTILCIRSSVVNVSSMTWGGIGTVTNTGNRIAAIQGCAVVLSFGGSVVPGNGADNIEGATSCHLIT